MNQREKIVDVAFSQVGYHEGDNNWNKYGDWYGMQNEPWCAIFVSWCAFTSGIPESIIPKEAYVPYFANWFDERGLYKNSPAWGGNYRPQKGDLILYDWDHTSVSDHIGIIVSVNGDELEVVEGNMNDQVGTRTINYYNNDIRAFCTPLYENDPQPVNKDVKIPFHFINPNEDSIPVYSDLFLTNEIGSLNPNEACDCFGTLDQGAIVMYEIDNTDHNYKVGFVNKDSGVIE